jgi:hypothetical protein
MPRFPCPICRDPMAYPLWVGKEPPDCCPHDAEHRSGLCGWQLAKARREALWRKEVPEAFDEMGVIKPGGLAIVLAALDKRGIPLTWP